MHSYKLKTKVRFCVSMGTLKTYNIHEFKFGLIAFSWSPGCLRTET